MQLVQRRECVAVDGADGVAHQVQLAQGVEAAEGALRHGADPVGAQVKAAQRAEPVERAVHVLHRPRDVVVVQLTAKARQITLTNVHIYNEAHRSLDKKSRESIQHNNLC